MNELHEEGLPYYKIADRVGRANSTVSKHCNGGCDHGREFPGINTIDDIGDEIEKLADDIERIPGPKDWDNWPKRPCASSTVQSRYGPWEDVLERSSLPIVPVWSPKPIRALAYQKPGLQSHSND